MKDLMNRNDLFDLGEMFDDLFRPVFVDKKIMHMRTDIKETNDTYELDIDLPGFKKNEIDVTLRDGYLTVSAKKKFDDCDCGNDCTCDDNCDCGCKETGECNCDEEHDCGCHGEENKNHEQNMHHHEHEHHEKRNHKFVRRERVYASTRSYYVGTKVRQEEIKAKYENGVLTLVVPKEKPKEATTQKITIE